MIFRSCKKLAEENARLKKRICELHDRLDASELIRRNRDADVQDFLFSDRQDWNALIKQKNDLFRRLEAEKKKHPVSLIQGDRPGRFYLEVDGIRHIFQDNEYQGFYNPDGPDETGAADEKI